MKVNCKIEIQGNKATISGVYPVEHVREVTSYPVEGAFFSPKYRNGQWDGRKHLFAKRTSSFPAGLTPIVVEAILEAFPGAQVEVADLREESPPHSANAGFNLPGLPTFGQDKHWYQLDCAKEMITQKRGIIKLATNAGKGSIGCAVINHLGLPTLYLVPDLSLLYQVRRQFSGYLGLSEDDPFFGLMGDGIMEYGLGVTIATPQTLVNHLKDNDIKENLSNFWQVIVCDESHRFASETFSEVMDACNAYYRFGLSGTPLDRSDGADLRLIAQTGPVVYEVSNKTLVELGVSVQPYLELVPMDLPNLKGKTWPVAQDLGIVNNDSLNSKAAEKVAENVAQGKQVVVIFDRLEQGNNICKFLDTHDVKYVYLKGADSAEERERVFNLFRKGKIQCILGTKILNQGIDIDCIDVLVLPGGGKAKISTLQRIGRGLRKKEGKESLLVIDFMISCKNKHLAKHSKGRLLTYQREDCFILKT